MSEPSEKIVERRNIPNQLLYDAALREHESIANDLTYPKFGGYNYVVAAIFNAGWQLLTEAEKAYQKLSEPAIP